MADPYALSLPRARIVRAIAVLFLFVGLGSVVGTIGSAVSPGLAIHCGAEGCATRTDLIDLAPDDAKAALAASIPAQAAFARHVTRLPVRLGLMATRMINALPFAILMAGVGFALRKLAARRGNDLSAALPWLRRAAAAALIMVIATPIANSLEAMVLFPGTPSGAMWYVAVDVRRLCLDSLFACAALSVAWALDAGGRAEREVANFV